MRLGRILCSAALALAASPALAATLNVPADYPTVGSALATATAGDVVQLAPGTYYEHSLTMPSGVTLRGNHGDPAVTVIDAQQFGRILTCTSSAASTVIEGLTIANGRFVAPYPNGVGGGIACFGASPQIRNCILAGNTSSSTGGALYLSGSSPVVVRTEFRFNSSGYAGAAAVTNSSQASFEDCAFLANEASVVGGAVDNAWWSDATYTRCSFLANHGEHGAGGFNSYYSNPTLSSCTFYDNSAGTVEHGGAHMLCDEGSSPIVSNSILAFGRVREAVLCKAGGAVSLTCTNIFGNEGGDWVGAIATQAGVNGNASADPQFCDAASDNLTLYGSLPVRSGPLRRMRPHRSLPRGLWPGRHRGPLLGEDQGIVPIGRATGMVPD